MGFAAASTREGAILRGPGSFTVHVAGPRERRLLDSGDLLSAALAYVDGRIDIKGDLFAALRALTAIPPRGLRAALNAAKARFWRLRPAASLLSRSRARSNIRFHYDHPPEFYALFLDERLVYSCAYFERPEMTLDEAQTAKLEHICRKLDLRQGERFLDIGCGFGALVAHAAGRYGAGATGCTLSNSQWETARSRLAEWGLSNRVTLEFRDYRDLGGTFDKIASVGMFEHVGVRRLGGYFAKVHEMLAPDGLFLNHGIARPQTVAPGAEWVFIQRRVFPGGDLPHLSEVVREAENAGFEVLDVENLRPHYAKTCRAWVERLIAREDEGRGLVGREVHRTWILFLAMSALNFESGLMEVHQVLLAKRSRPRPRHSTRRYMYP